MSAGHTRDLSCKYLLRRTRNFQFCVRQMLVHSIKHYKEFHAIDNVQNVAINSSLSGAGTSYSSAKSENSQKSHALPTNESLVLSSSDSGSLRDDKALAQISDIIIRLEQLEESSVDSLNVLTDRINELESNVSEHHGTQSARLSNLQSTMKHLLTHLVRKLITIVQSTIPRGMRAQSRIGMSRARQTSRRE